MSDYQVILGALVILYLSECVWWIRRGSVVFRRTFRHRWGLTHPSHGFGSTDAGMVFLNPFRLLGGDFECHQWPISITAIGIHAFVPQVINGSDRPELQTRYVTFVDVQSIDRDGAVLLINNSPFARLNSPALCVHFERLLRRLCKVPQVQRAEAISAALDRTLDCRRIIRRKQHYDQAIRPLAIVSSVLFLLLFGPLPLALARPEFRQWLLPAIGFILVSLIITDLFFFRVHKILYPREKALRWRNALMLLLAPTHAIRACDVLCRDLLAEYHPLAVALTLCQPQEARQIVRGILRDIYYPMEPKYPGDNQDQRCMIDEFHQMLQASVHACVNAAGINSQRWSDPPVRDDPSCQSYCPRCEMQFVIPPGTCSSCGGIALIRFPQPAPHPFPMEPSAPANETYSHGDRTTLHDHMQRSLKEKSSA